MAEIKDLLVCLLEYQDIAISKTRLTKLVYLCDWKHAIEHGSQMTRIRWMFDNYGPFVWDVMKTVEFNNDLFSVAETHTPFGNETKLISLNKFEYHKTSLKEEEKHILQFVVNTTNGMKWSEFIRLIYSTYPVVSSTRGQELDLVDLAREYKSSPFYQNVASEIEYTSLVGDEEDCDF